MVVVANGSIFLFSLSLILVFEERFKIDEFDEVDDIFVDVND